MLRYVIYIANMLFCSPYTQGIATLGLLYTEFIIIIWDMLSRSEVRKSGTKRFQVTSVASQPEMVEDNKSEDRDLTGMLHVKNHSILNGNTEWPYH